MKRRAMLPLVGMSDFLVLQVAPPVAALQGIGQPRILHDVLSEGGRADDTADLGLRKLSGTAWQLAQQLDLHVAVQETDSAQPTIQPAVTTPVADGNVTSTVIEMPFSPANEDPFLIAGCVGMALPLVVGILSCAWAEAKLLAKDTHTALDSVGLGMVGDAVHVTGRGVHASACWGYGKVGSGAELVCRPACNAACPDCCFDCCCGMSTRIWMFILLFVDFVAASACLAWHFGVLGEILPLIGTYVYLGVLFLLIIAMVSYEIYTNYGGDLVVQGAQDMSTNLWLLTERCDKAVDAIEVMLGVDIDGDGSLGAQQKEKKAKAKAKAKANASSSSSTSAFVG